MLKIETLSLGALGTNCYLVSLPASETIVVLDPGDDTDAITRAVAGRPVAGVLLTHAHYDHILGLPALRSCPIYIHAEDAPAVTNRKLNYAEKPTDIPATHRIQEGDILSLGGMTFTVLHTPGHTKGSVCYHCGNDLFTGDTLFAHGYGRTDLYGGSWKALTASLRRLLHLPAETHLYPGHGEDATLLDLRGNV